MDCPEREALEKRVRLLGKPIKRKRREPVFLIRRYGDIRLVLGGGVMMILALVAQLAG